MEHRLWMPCSVAVVGLVTTAALAGTVTWTYSDSSGGGNIEWWSQTTCAADADRYHWTSDITQVQVDVVFAGIVWGPFDITGDLPPSDLHREGVHDGSLPLIIVDETVEADGDGDGDIDVGAHIFAEINAKGRGHMLVTEVVLGDIWVELPWPFGEQLVDLDRIYLDGYYTVTEEYLPCEGDIDGDGVVDVTDLLAVIGDWGGGSGPTDVDGDGVVGVGDVLMVIAAWGPCQ